MAGDIVAEGRNPAFPKLNLLADFSYIRQRQAAAIHGIALPFGNGEIGSNPRIQRGLRLA
jgi:hypothetical protein